jgi:hypothetical protein
LASLAAFWLLGRRSAELAFFTDLGLTGATRRVLGATWARLVAFGCCTVAAAGGLACSSAFDVIVNLLIRQNAGFRTFHPSDVAARQATLCDKTLRISLISSASFPNL